MHRPAQRRIMFGFGWLLTPFLVWAAAFVSGWGAATLLPGIVSDRTTAIAIVIFAFLVSLIALVLWSKLLRSLVERVAPKKPDDKS